jgi:hypothetical protein
MIILLERAAYGRRASWRRIRFELLNEYALWILFDIGIRRILSPASIYILNNSPFAPCKIPSNAADCRISNTLASRTDEPTALSMGR